MPRRTFSRTPLSSTTSALAIALALGFVALAPNAYAQTAKEESVLHRGPTKDYAPDGIQLGSITISPRLEVGAQYDDNVFRTKSHRKDDISYHVSPSVSVTGDWDTVTLTVGASADFGRYVQYSSENYESFATNASLNYAISDDWSWGVAGSVGRAVQRRGFDTDNTTGKAATYWFYTAQSNLTYQGDPFAFRFSPVYRRYTFSNPGVLVSQNADRQEYELGGRFAYKVGANTSVFLDPSYTWVRYDSRLDAFGRSRNSEGYDVRAGIGYDISELLYVEVGVGYFHRTFEDHAFKAASGVSALAKAYWNPTDTLSFEALVSRGVSESDGFISNNVSSRTSVTTGAELRAGWLAADNILFDTGIAWYNFDYAVLSRKDNFYLFDIGGRYYVNRNIYTSLRYSMERRRSSESSLDYNDNRVMITIGGQL